MEAHEIAGLGKELVEYLSRFSDCFGRSEPREHLREYVRGQASELHRKSIEPIALLNGTPPRTLQRFLESVQWDEERLRDRVQWIVARDHAHPHAIGIVDESGHPKKGSHTAAVHHQYCGNTGKQDNCVMSVHTSYVAGTFQCILDSDLYLPEQWAEDPERREQAYVPEDVVYRKKTAIALDQIRRALGNGIRVAAWTFDEWYARDGEFLDGLEQSGQDYVGEVPSIFTGWVQEPEVLQRPRPQDLRKRGKTRRYPRVAVQSSRTCKVRNLLTYSRVFQRQKWRRFRVKDGEKGPIVWEIKQAPFWRKHQDGLPAQAGTLIVARNVLTDELKYFVSNMAVGQGGVTIEWLLWIAFSRWPIEHCFKQAKDELGMSHFEVRGWRSIHRHLYITQVSHLFCSRMRDRLGEKNGRPRVPDRGTGTRGRLHLVRGPGTAAIVSLSEIRAGSSPIRVLPAPQQNREAVAHQRNAPEIASDWHRSGQIEIVCAP
jgi:SRSO17 transposase